MVALTVATVTPWQHSSPGGGLIHTSWVGVDRLEPGMVIRDQTGWQPIVRLVALLPHRIVYAELPGDQWRCASLAGGYEVRGDMRWDYAPMSACGCWATDDGKWTCDKHLARRKRRLAAQFRPRTNRPLFHLVQGERRAAVTPVPDIPA